MKKKINELTEILSQVEGADSDPGHEQRMRDLRMHWDHANTDFHAAFYKLKQLSPDDAPTLSPATSDLKDAFKKMEECCKEWQQELGRFLPEG